MMLLKILFDVNIKFCSTKGPIFIFIYFILFFVLGELYDLGSYLATI